MRKAWFILLLLAALVLPGLAAGEETPAFVSVPALIKAGQYAEFSVDVPGGGTGTLLLTSEVLRTTHTLLSGYPLPAGESTLVWNGAVPGGAALTVGEYTLRLVLDDGRVADARARVGAPQPQLTALSQGGFTLTSDAGMTIAGTASEAGTLVVDILRRADSVAIGTLGFPVEAGENEVDWDGALEGQAVQDGEYLLAVSLRNAIGAESARHYLFVDVQATQTQLDAFNDLTGAIVAYERGKPSPPYSSVLDGSYWAMTPGETDDAAIWAVLTQPITVYDDGRVNAVGHVYMKENPDGTGASIAQIHGLSQGLHVVGEVNEYGYVLVEAFSNYDPSYYPVYDADRAVAFDLKRGYLLAEHLKQIDVRQDIGFVIDKLTQRMYMFIDGVRVTEFTISTGLITNGKIYYETIPGEFVTISFGGGYWSGGLYSDMAIRFNGGTMLHEVPHVVREDGTKYYGIYAQRLGGKHSAGCVRLPYRLNAEGYNHAWLWNNLDSGGRYKIIIWDDRNRNDSPAVWR